jgi:ketosteroid isomerase-like protein
MVHMNIKEIAERYVQMCNEGKNLEIYEELYTDEPISIEMPGGRFERSVGMEDIKKKGEWWEGAFEMHSAECSPALIADDHFAVTFTMDTTNKETGEREQMTELAILTVKDGKIAQEQFFYKTW